MNNEFDEIYPEEYFLEDGRVLVQVPNHKYYYVDTEQGVVYSIKTGKMKRLKMHERPTKHNYVTVGISGTTMGAHEVVMAAVQGNWLWKEEGFEVNHKNEKKNQNYADNLELMLHKEQFTDSVRKKMSEKKLGSLHPLSKLTEDDVIEIRERYREWDGRHIDFVSIVSDEYGVSCSCINAVVYGNTWQHILH